MTVDDARLVFGSRYSRPLVRGFRPPLGEVALWTDRAIEGFAGQPGKLMHDLRAAEEGTVFGPQAGYQGSRMNDELTSRDIAWALIGCLGIVLLIGVFLAHS